MKANWKDNFRTIKNEKKRLIALMLIAALGVTMMCGLKAACDDLRYSADLFFDTQNLHDIAIAATLGLTDSELRAIESVEGVEKVQGVYSKSLQMKGETGTVSAKITTFEADGIDSPYLIEGRLPEKQDEIAVTQKTLDLCGKKIGDVLVLDENLSEDETADLAVHEFIICGCVTDPTAIINPDGTTAYRDNDSEKGSGFVLPSAIASNIYTSVVVTLQDAAQLNSFSEEYENLIKNTEEKIKNSIQAGCEQQRTEAVKAEAQAELDDARKTAEAGFAEAEASLAAAREQLDSGWQQYEAGIFEAEQAEAELLSAMTELENARLQLEAGEKEYAEYAELYRVIKEIIEAILSGEEINCADAEALADQIAGLLNSAGSSSCQAGQGLPASCQGEVLNLNGSSSGQSARLLKASALEECLDDFTAALDNFRVELEEKEENLAAFEAAAETLRPEIESMLEESGLTPEIIKAIIEAVFDYIETQLAAARAELDAGWQQYDAGINAIEIARASLTEGRAELEKARLQLVEGEAEYEAGLAEYLSQKAEAEAELAEAQKEIDAIEACRWVIQDRSALNGYSAVTSDADCIEAIGTVFPVMFLLVAVLISLTTMTRMIEENRSAIGTYKGLGYTGREIRSKYLLYAALAALSGGILGNLAGYILLPEIIIIIFKTMYCIPEMVLTYNVPYGLAGIVLFIIGIGGAAFFSCQATLKLKTAELMRPKAPKNGSRILLEHITPVWRHLSFLNKVTARNLFRYKKRLLMTIFGIMGCTGLLICGFSIKDTVDDLMPNQYENIQCYDILVVNSGGEAQTKMMDMLSHQEDVESVQPFYLTTADLINSSGESLSLQLYVLPDEADLSDYLVLQDTEGNVLSIDRDGIYVTENAGDVLNFYTGSKITLRDASLNEANGEVSGLVTYYLGNIVFMNARTYSTCFGEAAPSWNAAMVNLSPEGDTEALTKEIKKLDNILSATSTESLAENFSGAFQLINMVVYVVIILAGLLAFEVLFTLSTTNISERERELATIKVLGFNDREVFRYVNKETLILTGVGILCGIPLGIVLSQFIGIVLSLPGIVYRPSIHALSYVLAAGIALIFALIVNGFTNRVVKKIDPVTALKSVE